jgi:hypothetical protein
MGVAVDQPWHDHRSPQVDDDNVLRRGGTDVVERTDLSNPAVFDPDALRGTIGAGADVEQPARADEHRLRGPLLRGRHGDSQRQREGSRQRRERASGHREPSLRGVLTKLRLKPTRHRLRQIFVNRSAAKPWLHGVFDTFVQIQAVQARLE